MTDARGAGEAAAARYATWTHRGFLVSMGFKAFDGIVELAGGTILSLVTQPQLQDWILHLTHGELDEDPTDFTANLLRRGAARFTEGARHQVAVYLLIEGAIKLLLVLGLLRGLRSAWPVSLALLGLFCAYQCIRLAQAYSPWLATLLILNLLVMTLIAAEWRLRSASAPGRS